MPRAVVYIWLYYMSYQGPDFHHILIYFKVNLSALHRDVIIKAGAWETLAKDNQGPLRNFDKHGEMRSSVCRAR